MKCLAECTKSLTSYKVQTELKNDLGTSDLVNPSLNKCV